MKRIRPVSPWLILPFFLLHALVFALSAGAADHGPDEMPVKVGLTPVFLDDQTAFLTPFRDYLSDHLGRPVEFVQRSSYAEITDLLLSGDIKFAWICGYPYVRNSRHLALVAVPLYKGDPLYRSYIIVPAHDETTRNISDLQGKIFAYSDPDSNSGYIYPRHLLLESGEQPDGFFSKSFFTWSHRKVIESVASGLALGGAVDGYVWDKMAREYPELVAMTRVVGQSQSFGFPPVVAGPGATDDEVMQMRTTLTSMATDPQGTTLLERILLDGFVPGHQNLFDEIARMSAALDTQ